MPSNGELSVAVVWQKCYLGNVDGEQIVWVCRTREEAQSVSAFLAAANPHLNTIEANAPRYMQFTTRPALPAEVAGCACLIKRLRDQPPHLDDDALKLSRLVLENHALLGIELLQEGFIARFTSPPTITPRGMSSAEGWRSVIEKLNVVAANTSHLAKISAATQGTQHNTGRMLGAMEDGRPAAGGVNVGASPSSQASHSADFTFVRWYGTDYTFALGVQSSAVKALWQEWERTGLGLHQDTIRSAIDAERDSFRMDTAFRSHPALGTMIVRCGDGKYKLAPPGTSGTPEPKARPSAGFTAGARSTRG